MVCVRFTSLLLGLSLCLVALGEYSIAFAHPAINTLANHDRDIEANNNKELEVLDAESTGSKRLRGRKMGAIDEPSTKKEIMEGRKNAAGAKPYVGKCGGGGKGELNLECELRESRSLPSAKLVALISISSDYHPAKTHPPKNN